MRSSPEASTARNGGNIIVDSGQGRSDYPQKKKRTISQKEEFRQGDRVQAYLLDVKRDSKCPQILYPRVNPNCPETPFSVAGSPRDVYEGIVEIKSIARDVGERTKIVVCSKDVQVDLRRCLRGDARFTRQEYRFELQGGRSTSSVILPTSRNISRRPLSPAEISQIQLNYDGKRKRTSSWRTISCRWPSASKARTSVWQANWSAGNWACSPPISGAKLRERAGVLTKPPRKRLKQRKKNNNGTSSHLIVV